MSSRAVASRYARALFDVVVAENGSPEQVERELGAIADLIAGHAELRGVLTNPAIPVSGKRGVVQSLVSRTSMSPVLAKLLLMLADRDRVGTLPDLVEVYRERVMDHQQVVRAEVTTAMPLAPDRAAQLQGRLAEVTGRRVMMTTKVDSALIGGVVARIGSTVYDGSVATQLETIRQKLLEQG
jgi:F-type H+-transporting ATPase subunit delta